MPLLTTQIEIAAPPAVVREKFLAFDQIPHYHKDGFIQSITITTPDKTAFQLTPGDRMNNVVGRGSMKIKPYVRENSPKAFIWGDSIPLLFSGAHAFRFEEIEGSSDGATAAAASTLFVHEEEFGGLLGFVMGEGWVARLIGLREFTRVGFSEFNRDLKAWVEGGQVRE